MNRQEASLYFRLRVVPSSPVPPNKAMQTDRRFAAAADRQDVMRHPNRIPPAITNPRSESSVSLSKGAAVPQPTVRITQINIVAEDFEATARFYRELGLRVPQPTSEPPGSLHAEADAGNIQLAIDNENLTCLYHSAARKNQLQSRAIIGVTVATRSQVDDIYNRLVAAGFSGRQRPYDAFWGSRYAIVADPNGNDVGLMSLPDAEHRSWPPAPSPE